MAISTTDTKVRFLSGTLANLATVPVTDGNIYVTTDERVMHVDIGGQRLRLSDIVWVKTTDDLPKTPPATSAQAFYYIENDNILVRYKASSNGWSQVNALPDLTSLVHTGSNFSYTNETNGASAKLNLLDAGTDKKDATPYAKVTVVSGNANTTKVSSNASGIVVNSADTTIKSTLGVSHNNDSGNSTITLTETTGGYNADGSVKATSTTSTQVDIVGAGVTTSVTGSTLTIDATPTKIVPSFDAAGAFKIAYTTADNTLVNSTTVSPSIKVGKNTTLDASFKNGVARLDGVYTAAEVDAAINAQLKTANAMVFEGTVTPEVKLPVSAPRGATYMASAEGTITTAGNTVVARDAKIGDLFIAYGDEVDGVIKTVDWKYIPAGDDDIPKYTATADASGLTIVEDVANTKTNIGKVLVGAGLVGSGAKSDLTISHATKDVTATSPTQNIENSSYKLIAVSGVSYDDYGHIASVATTTYTVPDHSIASFVTTTGVTGNKATITTKVQQTSSSVPVTNAWTIESENLEVATSGSAGIKINLTWGAF